VLGESAVEDDGERVLLFFFAPLLVHLVALGARLPARPAVVEGLKRVVHVAAADEVEEALGLGAIDGKPIVGGRALSRPWLVGHRYLPRCAAVAAGARTNPCLTNISVIAAHDVRESNSSGLATSRPRSASRPTIVRTRSSLRR